ncbi:MAG: 3-hydroxyacyl-ACP dehydratase FabZ [Spirochaetia bacterium]|jgi:3-hydroxyacyl-[acyl-carrier-protein] dehydratase|nr:3-hydroxyacyl-ACP dehydratase FabZ [Spirochaetia bacterium]
MKASGSEIESILPHRAPFLFVDSAELGDDGIIRARHLFRPDEPFFAGHFPDYPVVPGVLLIETLAQAGGVGFKLSTGVGGVFFLATVNNVKYRRQVRPGDLFEMEVVTLRGSAKLIKQSGKGYVGGELAVEAEWLCIAAAEEDLA